jgi:hypothetical protein
MQPAPHATAIIQPGEQLPCRLKSNALLKGYIKQLEGGLSFFVVALLSSDRPTGQAGARDEVPVSHGTKAPNMLMTVGDAGRYWPGYYRPQLPQHHMSTRLATCISINQEDVSY